MKMKFRFVCLLCCVLIIGCKATRDRVRILFFTPSPELFETDKLKIKTDWEIIQTNGNSLLSEDSLTSISAIVIRISDLNNLDHRAIPMLKRYLEAGGGMVALRDTVWSGTDWPWIETWLEKEDGTLLDHEEGRLAIIAEDATTSEAEKAILFAIGRNIFSDYSAVQTKLVPDTSRYTREVLVEGLDEPLQMAILPNNNVLFIERKGGIKLYEDSSGLTKTVANLHVFSGIEDGLLGVAIDPNFSKNNWVYFYFAVAGDSAINHLSRFELHGDSLALDSEKVILKIPTQRVYCCHSAGYIAFDKNGLLYLSTGDNTNAEETEGYTPVDERQGRSLSDNQGTAASTNDLRGKILRIKPLPGGSYDIPDGNLFPKDGSSGRPEIYVMGARNPFRYSIDTRNGYLYFGDVGPDTKVKASTGEPMSFDEINQVKKPGFYGWPYFLGNNEVFPKYNFETKKEEPGKNPDSPINSSPNNKGVRELPAANPAMIWYGKDNSARFPKVGSGGASAMAGPVFYSSDFKEEPYQLSDYYDGKLFIYEWIRGWILAVSFDDNGEYLRMEPFLENIKFEAPVDMQFASDGSIYLLEYGTNWFSKNTNAKLVRIRYKEGNRAPNAVIDMDKQYGGAPMSVQFSAGKSLDHDQSDKLTFIWEIEGEAFTGETLHYTFNEQGIHEVTLTAKDNKGGVGKSRVNVFVGNTPPAISIISNANKSFYWDDGQLDYHIKVEDKEEAIDPERLKISFGFMPFGKDAAIVLTSNQDISSLKHMKGKAMVASLDCKSCHSLDKESVGPSYQAIADRYAGKKGSLKILSQKVIAGGGGNWGERAMSPHPAVSQQEANEMVAYILALAEDDKQELPMKGTLMLREHAGKGQAGAYLLSVTYKDKGANGIGELQSHDYILLKNPVIEAEDFDEGNVGITTITTSFQSYITGIYRNKYIRFNAIDLTDINGLRYKVQTNGVGGTIEVHLDRVDGPVVSRIVIPSAGNTPSDVEWKELQAVVKKTTGTHDLFFVFTGIEGIQNYFNADWIKFQNR